MRVAIPLEDGAFCRHFGHCQQFALIDADEEAGTILGRSDIDAPPHEPGLLPGWLCERGVTVVLAGGIGQKATELLEQKGVIVKKGVEEDIPETMVTKLIAGELVTGVNNCHH